MAPNSLADLGSGATAQPVNSGRFSPIDVSLRFHEERITPDVIVMDDLLLPYAREGDMCEVLDNKETRIHLFTLKKLDPEIRRKLPNVQVGYLLCFRMFVKY